MVFTKKIVNDPVHGFIDLPAGRVMEVVEHPYVQRLRNIRQLGMAHLVYPGACHTRFSHAVGAMSLMKRAVDVLRNKGIRISGEEEEAALLAILLHDIGHGPFSHALENSIISLSHEEISLELMHRMDAEFCGMLGDAVSVFTGSYPLGFLHQLVSGQLDVDRLDYLSRDSFYSGVAEGMIGLDRIISMLTVSDGRLVVEEKGIHSVEKFLISRRLMYWQVYLHKTVLAAEMLMINILRRASELFSSGVELEASPSLAFLLRNGSGKFAVEKDVLLDHFVKLDDSDVMYSVKRWTSASDRLLSFLSRCLCERKLPRVVLSDVPVADGEYEECMCKVMESGGWSRDEAGYLVARGNVSNKGYSSEDVIYVARRNGVLENIYDVSDMLSAKAFSDITKRYYIYKPKYI